MNSKFKKVFCAKKKQQQIIKMVDIFLYVELNVVFFDLITNKINPMQMMMAMQKQKVVHTNEWAVLVQISIVLVIQKIPMMRTIHGMAIQHNNNKFALLIFKCLKKLINAHTQRERHRE